jgi:L-fuconolactonase
LLPAVRHVRSAFGEDRLIFGSDWPVCLLAAEYGQVKEAAMTCLQAMGAADSSKVWGSNAIEAYHLDMGDRAMGNTRHGE